MLDMTLGLPFLHSNFVLVSPHESSTLLNLAVRMGRQNASEPLMGMSVCAGMDTSPVTMAEPA